MNYPVWEITTLGGPFLIALFSIPHVFVAHFAVGGGLFIWLTDWKGLREKDPRLQDYVKRHTWFFVLLTMVFGGVSGVGIWFIIGLVHPSGTSVLIHNYVFGWAIEWVFFLGEITALLVYFYYFDRLDPRTRLQVAFVYFLFAWLSLLVINGILSSMLTPGTWLDTGDFWDGFFNPGFLPSLFFRTFAATMFAGMFAYVTVVFLRESAFRLKMMRYGTRWMLLSFIGLVPSSLWYFFSVPAEPRFTAFTLNHTIVPFMTVFFSAGVLIFIFGLLFILKMRPLLQKTLVFVLIGMGLAWMGGFEYMREIARKPYVIYGHMYSNSIRKGEIKGLNRVGVLAGAGWSRVKKVNADRTAAGREIFTIECLSCHTAGGIYNDILDHAERFTYQGMKAQLRGQGKLKSYMPPFVGTEAERDALAEYICFELLGKGPEKTGGAELSGRPVEIPEYDREQDEYLLLSWSDPGIRLVSDSDRWLYLRRPGNTLEALLIRRGEVPEVITQGVRISYEAEPGFAGPLHSSPDREPSGSDLKGNFVYDEARKAFVAENIPVMPYQRQNGKDTYNPFPLFNLEARDAETGKVMVATRVVSAVSTEIGCRRCHGGEWRRNGAGLSDDTAVSILDAHDRSNRTGLYKRALAGAPVDCRECHAGKKGLDLSAAIHGLHAVYMTGMKSDSCMYCHPPSLGLGTGGGRGIHGTLGVTCVQCHGSIQDRALALLAAEKEKPAAGALIKSIEPGSDLKKEEILAGEPGQGAPDCLGCHVDFEAPKTGSSAFNRRSLAGPFSSRTDDSGMIRCQACHGAMHSLYPSRNPTGRDRDNIQPLQYGGMPLPIGSNLSCEVCHMTGMSDSVHHENMERTFRNVKVLK